VAAACTVLDDYAHHPTAVRETLAALRAAVRQAAPDRASTSRARRPRGARTFQRRVRRALFAAGRRGRGRTRAVRSQQASRRTSASIPSASRSTCTAPGTKAAYMPDVDAMVAQVRRRPRGPGDVVVVLSSGAFDGVHDKLLDASRRRGPPGAPRRHARGCAGSSSRRRQLPPTTAGDDRAGDVLLLHNEDAGMVGCGRARGAGRRRDPALAGGHCPTAAASATAGCSRTPRSAGPRIRGVRHMYLVTEHRERLLRRQVRLPRRRSLARVDRRSPDLDVPRRHRARWWPCGSICERAGARAMASSTTCWRWRARRRRRGRAPARRPGVRRRAPQGQPARSGHRVGRAQPRSSSARAWRRRAGDDRVRRRGGRRRRRRAVAARWLVDPDRRHVNFAHGLPLWAVSIGLELEAASVEVGVVHARRRSAGRSRARGGGATRTANSAMARAAARGEPTAEHRRALLVTGFPYDRATNPDNNFAEWEHFQRARRGCRRLGAASLDLCLVARGCTRRLLGARAAAVGPRGRRADRAPRPVGP
jgi:hypothetical protein